MIFQCPIPADSGLMPVDSSLIPADSSGFLQEWEGHCKVLHLCNELWILRAAPAIVIAKVSKDRFNQWESAIPTVIHDKNMLVSKSADVKESVAIDIKFYIP